MGSRKHTDLQKLTWAHKQLACLGIARIFATCAVAGPPPGALRTSLVNTERVLRRVRVVRVLRCLAGRSRDMRSI